MSTSTQMEVVIVEAIDPALPRMGGGEVYSHNLLEYLLKMNIPTTLIGVSSSNGHSTQGGFLFVPVAKNASLGNLSYVLRLVASGSFSLVRPGAIVHVQRPEYALPFALLCRNNPKLVTLHGRILHGVRLKQPRVVARIYRMVESFCLRHSAAIIAVDDGTKEFYEEEYPWLRGKIRVIPIGIDLTRFKVLDRDHVRAKWGFKRTEKVVMYVGRLEIEKDLGFLIESFRLVLRQVPNARLVLVGDGRDRRRLEEIAQDLSLEELLFMGAQKPDCMPEILNCADVLTLCSLYEGSPTTVKEALACGVPVVCTRVGDVCGIVRGNVNGRVVPKDAQQFSQAIVDILSTEDREIARRQCVNSASEFGFDQIGARTVGLYRELLVQDG